MKTMFIGVIIVAIITLVALVAIVFIGEYQKQKELDDRLDRIKEYVELNSEETNVFREIDVVEQEKQEEKRTLCEKMFFEGMLTSDERPTTYTYCLDNDMEFAIDIACIKSTGSKTGLNFMDCVDKQHQKLSSLIP